MKMLSIVVLQSAIQEQKSPKLEISEMIDLLLSEFQSHQFTQYVTAKEVAYIFQVEPKTIRAWVKNGKLRAYRYGHRVFFKFHELINVIKH